MFRNLVKRLLGWVGYKTNDEYDMAFENYKNLFNQLKLEIEGLVFSIGELERHRKDLNMIITALLSNNLQEEVELKIPALQELYDKGYTINLFNNKAGNVVVQLVTKEEDDEEEVI